MLKPGLWPPNRPRATESHAELAVYEALAKQLPKGWYAWHSLRIRVPGHPDAEADFIIVDPARGKLCWAFRDPDQVFWPNRRIQARLFQTRYQLQQKYRCAAPVLQLAQCYLNAKPEAKMLRNSLNPEIVAVRACPGPGTVLERIAHEIDKLKGSGLAAADIAVLSLRGAAEPGAIVHRERIGLHRVVRADDPEAGSNVVTETFLRFKGLERSAIIITDVGLALDKQDYPKRMYIALTRALSTVRITDTRDALTRDPILSPFC